jgi:hypothetical protein
LGGRMEDGGSALGSGSGLRSGSGSVLHGREAARLCGDRCPAADTHCPLPYTTGRGEEGMPG